MIERTYMGIDGRRDHSFRIPRPDLTEETGAPSACIDCHADRDPSWAAAEIARHYPNSERRGPHFSQTFAVARNDPAAVDDQLLKIAEDGETPGIVRATALDLLRPITSSGIATRVVPLLDDGDLLVRLAAVPMQRGAEEADRIRRLVPVLDDPRQAIRIAAARALLDADLADLPGDVADGVQAAMGEWQASLIAKADFPETHMVIGGAALVQRNPNAAEQAFREAVRLDPQAVDAWTMIARILTATGNPDGARGALDEGLRANPSNDRLRSLREELEAAMAR